MATNQTTQGSVTLRKLFTGETAMFSLSSDKTLFQLYTENAGGGITPVPDWSQDGNGPTVQVVSSSSNGNISVTGVVWKIDGASADSFGTASGSNGVFLFKFTSNVATDSNRKSRLLTAVISFSDGKGHSGTVEKSEVIRVQRAVSEGYTVLANREDLGDANIAKLTGVLYHGTSIVTDRTNFELKWYDSYDAAKNLSITPVSGSPDSIVVTQSMVNGSRSFVCRAYKAGTEDVLDSEAVTVVDTSDSLYLRATAQQYVGDSPSGPPQANCTSVDVEASNTKTVVSFAVVDGEGNDYASPVGSWKVEKRHAGSLKLIGEVTVSGNTQSSVTMDTDTSDAYNTSSANSITVFDKDYRTVGSNASGASHYEEVVVTADAEI